MIDSLPSASMIFCNVSPWLGHTANCSLISSTFHVERPVSRYGRLKLKFLCERYSHCFYSSCSIELTKTRNTWSLTAVWPDNIEHYWNEHPSKAPPLHTDTHTSQTQSEYFEEYWPKVFLILSRVSTDGFQWRIPFSSSEWSPPEACVSEPPPPTFPTPVNHSDRSHSYPTWL